LKRPNWGRIYMLLARVDELQEKPEQALANFLTAISLGERQPEIVRRAVEMLKDRQRFAQAEGLIQTLLENPPISQGLQILAAEIAVRAGNPRAFELANDAIKNDSGDYRDHLWLG